MANCPGADTSGTKVSAPAKGVLMPHIVKGKR